MITNILNSTVHTPLEKVAFTIGSLEVRWYGIFIFIGFTCAIVLACLKLAKWYKVPFDPFFYFVFIGIPTSILGARLWSFIIGDAEVPAGSNFFVEYWNFGSGGLAIQGGVLFTVIAACIWFPLILKKPKYHIRTSDGEKTYVRQISMWVYADAIIPCILVGQIIGRWGNFFNQEVYGAVVDNPEVTFAWLKNFMPGVYENMFINGTTFHQPLFLYESFANFWVFLFLYIGCEFIKIRKAGDIGFGYFLFYGIVRLIMEPFRSQQYMYVTSIVMSVMFIVAGVAGILLNHFLISQKRDWKFLYSIYIKSKYYLNFNNWNQIKQEMKNHDKNIEKKYGYAKAPSFYRKPEEMLYYNNL